MMVFVDNLGELGYGRGWMKDNYLLSVIPMVGRWHLS
jgi:hypothetical protein